MTEHMDISQNTSFGFHYLFIIMTKEINIIILLQLHQHYYNFTIKIKG